MTSQLHFFDAFDAGERCRPPAQRVRTSIAAAETIADTAGTLRGRIYAKILASGWHGATREELVDDDLTLETICASVNELLKLDLIYDSGTTRPGKLGRQQVVVRCRGTRKPTTP